MPETIPPVVLDQGMFCSAPTQLVPANKSEQLFNWFYTPAGALTRRPGSVFFARLGHGPVVGLYEHSFESSLADPVLVAVVGDALAEAWALCEADEGAGTGNFAFIPDVRHGETSLQIGARSTDRFTFASLFDTVYLAGSTLLPAIYFYEYTERRFRSVPSLPVTGVFTLRQRLYGYGNANHPNYLYPSGYADPETFDQNLAIQVGASNARIVLGLPALDRAILFTTSGVWQYDGYAIENGDLDLREIDLQSSIAGADAACVGGDGYVYWLDPKAGPSRWTLGLSSADTDFATPMKEVFRRMHRSMRDQASVRYDPVHEAVHFSFSLEGQENDYTASFFPGRGWTHSASTTDTAMVGSEALEGDEVFTVPRGEGVETLVAVAGDTRYTGGRGLRPGLFPTHPGYTVLLSRTDPLSGDAQMLGADADGYVWRWTAGSKDKARGSEARPGWAFTTLWRSGTFEIANVEKTGMVHRVMLDLEAPGDFAFDFRVERDYSRLFHRTHQIDDDEFPGELGVDFILGEGGSPLARAEAMPQHRRLPLWRNGIGKVLRYEMQTLTPLMLLGIEHSLSRTAR